MITDQGLQMNDEDSTMSSGENEFKLQVIHRIMKKALPNHALVSKDAKSFIEEKVVALIQNVTRKAREVAGEEHRTKIKGADLVKVFRNSGLFLYGNVLDTYMEAQQNRDTPSLSTETDAYDYENMEDTDKTTDQEISDVDALQDASDEDMLSDLIVSDSTSDRSDCFEVPQTIEQKCLETTESDGNDYFSSIDVVDLLEGEDISEDISSDCVRMPDSWMHQITQNLKDGATSSSQMPATGGADSTSDLPTSVSVPSWTLKTRSIPGFVMPPIDIPELTVDVSTAADVDADENEVLAAGSSPVSPSPEIHHISIPAWTIPPTTVSGVRIPSVHIPPITVRRRDKEALETDMTTATHRQEGQSGEEPRDHNSIFGVQDSGFTPEMREVEHNRTNSGETGQILSLQEPYSFVFDLDPDGFDTEAPIDYAQGFLDE